MISFKQFIESIRDKDIEQLKDYGLKPSRMNIYKIRKKPKPPIEDFRRRFEFLKIVIPPGSEGNVHPSILKYNNQIVSVTPSSYGFGLEGNVVSISPLTGRKDEGMFINVPYEFLEVPSKKEVKHGQWLSNSFFQRKDYVPLGDKRKVHYFNYSKPNVRDILRQAQEELQNHRDPRYRGMAEELEEDPNIDLWMIATDMLDDIGYDTGSLRELIKQHEI